MGDRLLITVSTAPILVILFLLWAAPATVRLSRAQTTRQIEGAFMGFVIYLLFLVYLTLTPFAFRYEPLSRDANLRFWVETEAMIRLGTREAWTYNVFGNLLMLVPFAFFLPLLFGGSGGFAITLFYTLLLSFTIEGLQWVMGVRLFDIDDILFNTLGAIPGYVLYLIFRKIALPAHPWIGKPLTFLMKALAVFITVVALGMLATYLYSAVSA